MKFRYLGDKETMTAFGYDFSNGNEPDVTDEHAIAKLSGNQYFEAVESEDNGRPNVRILLAAISTIQTVEELDKLAQGEDRTTVLNAITKKRAQLQG